MWGPVALRVPDPQTPLVAPERGAGPVAKRARGASIGSGARGVVEWKAPHWAQPHRDSPPSPAARLGFLDGRSPFRAQRGAEGQMGPQLFDGNAGINMALQQRGQDITFQGMQDQAKAAMIGGVTQAAGSIAGGIAGQG